MKIAFISFYSGYLERGAENWVMELGNCLSNKSEVTVFQVGESNGKEKYKVVEINISGIKNDSQKFFLRRFFLDARSLQIGFFTLKIFFRLLKGDFDIVIPINGGWEVILIKLLSIFKRNKVVVVSHSGIGWDERINLVAFPDLFIALTPSIARWAKKVNPFVKVEYIPNGVSLEKFKPGDSKLTTKLQKPIILFVGALSKSKGILQTIEAVAKNRSKISLMVVGDGELKGEVEVLGKKMLGDRFEIRKFSYQDMPEVYRLADLFTLVSWVNEAFPLVYLEALATNLPIVATKDESRETIVGQAGILVNPSNIEGYSKALVEALGKEWGELPRMQAKKFEWKEIANRYNKVFQKILRV